eukprot:TRINITY_DN444_c0_g1_i1.p1 TRINITY_DN444_c0_g1~~TRINITY_DN444_c0_g1_i1.p1  ORF type:complete len:203 (-),score=30.14 TRINITY_DN444_c0_g1_i1:479-1087(-)
MAITRASPAVNVPYTPLYSELCSSRKPISRSSVFHKPALVGTSRRIQSQRLKLLRARVSVKHDVLVEEDTLNSTKDDIGIVRIHHVGLLCQNLEKSLEFYQGILGLKINEARPNEKLPYRGKWLWVGSEMIHLMELPNPDPLTGRPEHGGRDRHTCIAIKNVNKLKSILDEAGIAYTLSRSGRPAIFTRDPDGNALEFTQIE